MNTSNAQAIPTSPRRGEWHPRMRAAHPSVEALSRFARGEASREESRQVVAHLLGRCPACGRVVSGLARLTEAEDRE
jgi:hypothetical protein